MISYAELAPKWYAITENIVIWELCELEYNYRLLGS